MSSPSRNEFQIGWICALAVEAAAAKEMLDEKFEPLDEQDATDPNAYILGRIGKHNIVIACLPAGQYGTSSATTVANHLTRTFSKSLRVGLMVGVGGGIPSSENDVRLGDVVISCPVGTYGGVVQYDMGKHVAGGEFSRTGSLNSPPRSLLTAVSRLRANELTDDPEFFEYIETATERTSRTKKLFRSPGPKGDRLFKAEHDHTASESSCDPCPSEWEVRREARDDDLPRTHYGLIASGNSVIKDGRAREKLGAEIGALCFEMEAAGLMLDFPCIVIRGICDYSDTHKNKQWQGYAALVAASYAKELLGNLPHNQVTQEQLAANVCQSIENLNETVRGTNERLDKVFDQQVEQFNEQKATAFVEEHHSCHKALKTSNYEGFKDINPSRAPGTCQWVLENQTYLEWRDGSSSGLLWVSADPGCGKSVLSKSLIDIYSKELDPGTLVCHFFFKDNEQQNRLNVALCALLHQIFTQEPALISYAMDLFRKTGDSIQHETSALWGKLLEVASESKAPEIICVLDALDECTSKDVEILIQNLCRTFEDKQTSGNFEGKARLKFFVTSRPYLEIQTLFSSLTTTWPQIRLKGEEENDQIKKEIDIVIAIKMQQLAREAGLSSEVQKRFETQLLEMESRTYLWLHLALDDIRTTLNNSLQPDAESIRPIPPTVNAAYSNILARVQADQFSTVKKILLIICGARRPLTVQEMAIALGIALKPEASNIQGVQLDPARLSSRIRSLCGLFVIITDSRIHLLHQTAKEFLIRDNSLEDCGDLDLLYPLRRTDTESMLAEICVRYLLMDDFRGSGYRFELWRGDSEASKLQNCPEHPVHGVYTFLEYSADHWARHVRHMSSDRYFPIEDLIYQLYDTSSQSFLIWFNLFWEDSPFRPFWSQWVDWDFSVHPLCLAALNGHKRLLGRFLQESNKESSSPYWIVREERDPICENETCAFIWSSWAGHYDNCCLLLEQGARLHPVAWNAALFQVDTKIMQLLLERGGDSMKKYVDQKEYLQKASGSNDLAAVLLLLDAGFDINSREGPTRGTALEEACSSRHIEVVKLLLNRGADPNARGSHYDQNYGALYIACERQSFEIAEILLARGAQVNPSHDLNSYDLPLNIACIRANVDIVKLLIEKGADVNRRGDSRRGGLTPLESACKSGSVEIVRILIQSRAHVSYDALYNACGRGNSKTVEKLVERGAQVNSSDNSSLYASPSRADVEIVKLLIENGVDVNKGDFSMPLEAACQSGSVEIARILIESGANVNAYPSPASFRSSCLTVALEGDNMDLALLLLENGAQPNHPQDKMEHLDWFYRTALQTVCGREGGIKGAKLLLDRGADVNARLEFKDTALAIACGRGDVEIIKLLLQRGAQVDPGAFVAAATRVEIMYLLREQKPDLNALSEDKDGRTAIEEAASGFDLSRKPMEYLLNIGADGQSPNFEKAFGRALIIVSGHDDPQGVKMLLDAGASACFYERDTLSSLHVAAEFDCVENMRLLLKGGADVNLNFFHYFFLEEGVDVDSKNYVYYAEKSPLGAASSKGNFGAVSLMLSEARNGTKILDRTYHGALVAACWRKSAEMVKFLLEAGVDAQLQDDERNTALHVAARKIDLDLAKLLLEHGASPNSPSTGEGCPLRIACARDDDLLRVAQLEIVRMLLKYGADVNEHSGRSGTTALIEASQAGRLDIVKLLLQKGANIHAVDGYRFSALMLAAAHGHVHIVRVLIGRGAHINYRREITKFDQEDREEEEDSQLQFAYPPSYKVRGIRVDDPWETALQAASACSRDPNDDPMVDLLLENGAIS